MLTNRRTFNVKTGCMEAAIQLLKDTAVLVPVISARPYRLQTAYFGPFDVLAMEFDFESLKEYEDFWGAVIGHAVMEAFFEKWNVLTSGGGVNELWETQ
jgi:hypothetical protein